MLDNDNPTENESDGSKNGNARSAGYSSPSIVARRNRILDETRRMIGEVGLTNLSMDDVAKRANVAKRTLYNAFQSKEHLVASAISKYMDAYERKISYSTNDATLAWMLERLVIVARRNLEIRNYIRALMNIYYSTDVDPGIRAAIHYIAALSQDPWIQELAARRQLQPWIDPSTLSDMLVRFRFATAHAWAEGEIADEALVVELVRGFLTLVAGATRASTRKEILDVLAGLEQNPLLSAEFARLNAAK